MKNCKLEKLKNEETSMDVHTVGRSSQGGEGSE
jgi:hypothetical protein